MVNTERTTFSGELREVLSGDDLIILIDLGAENLYLKQRVRLAGVDAPDARGKGPASEAGTVRDKVRTRLRNRPLRVEVKSRGGRSWVAEVTFPDPDQEGAMVSVNSWLISMGYTFKPGAKL